MKLVQAENDRNLLTFKSGESIIVLAENRIVVRVGWFSPWELRKAFKIYNSIINQNNHEKTNHFNKGVHQH
jgi:hypothetical protein